MNKFQQNPVNFNQALNLVLSYAEKFRVCSESVSLPQALDRCLAEDLRADSDKPAAANSSMDGYCLRSADVAGANKNSPVVLPVAPGVDAGNTICELPSGHCAYIATGAPLPKGADAIERIENVPEGFATDSATFSQPVPIGQFIRAKGAEQRQGQLIAASGQTLSPFLIAIAASIGFSAVKVKCRPSVGIIASGDELVMPWEKPQPWQVRNSNSLMLSHQVSKAGGTPIDFGIARDDEEHAIQLFEQAIEKSDIVLTSGGISMGRKDPFRNLFAQLHVEPIIYGVTIKPGKPFFFGFYKDKPVFALPGNMVSTAVTFELFVRTFIRKALGLPCNRIRLRLKLTDPVENTSKRDFFGRGRLIRQNEQNLVEPLTGQESHMLSSLADTDLLFLHPADTPNLSAGSEVECLLLRNESAF